MNALAVCANSLANLLYPLCCLGCGARIGALSDTRLCDACVSSIRPNAMPPFELENSRALVHSACLYDGTLKELIHSFKYRGKAALARIFCEFMMGAVVEDPGLIEVDIVTAVPLYRARLKAREFNQSLLLARGIAKRYGLPAAELLKKRRVTKCQSSLTKAERLVNLKGAFGLGANARVKGSRVLLVDDVMTTGATLDECAKTLLSGGASSVACLTLARGI
jgi:ComF family protein